jgi:hypothetical protein
MSLSFNKPANQGQETPSINCAALTSTSMPLSPLSIWTARTLEHILLLTVLRADYSVWSQNIPRDE